MLCKNDICPCRWHSMKIKNDFFDIFEVTFTLEEEREIIEKATGMPLKREHWESWNDDEGDE